MSRWKPRLYLKTGDRVLHIKYTAWGVGSVVEEMHSIMDGGTCIVRVMFDDGVQRSFINDLDSELCCYFAGVRIKD